MTDLDHLIELARPQGGLVTRQEARSAGISDHRLSRLVHRGAIARVTRGVYLIGNQQPVVDARSLTDSWKVVLSCQSAAAWYGIELPATTAVVHVTAPRTRGRWAHAERGVRLHRSTLTRADIAVVRGVRVTTPLRTALDLARRAPLEYAVAAIDSFMRAKLLSADEFVTAVSRANGPGRTRMGVVAMLIDPARAQSWSR